MDNYFENPEWKKQRLGRFTSSEHHQLFESGRGGTPYFGKGAETYIRTKVGEIMTMTIKDEVPFKQAEWGNMYEHIAKEEYEKAIAVTGEYYGNASPKFYPYGNYAGGSPDWEVPNKRGADFKCPFNTAEHIKNLTLKGVDDFKKERWEYYCQGQGNMLFCGWESFDFVSYDARMIEDKYKLKIITMYPDQEWIKEYQERIKKAIERVDEILTLLDNSNPPITITQPLKTAA